MHSAYGITALVSSEDSRYDLSAIVEALIEIKDRHITEPQKRADEEKADRQHALDNGAFAERLFAYLGDRTGAEFTGSQA